MAFDVGAIVARLELNDRNWKQAIDRVTKDNSLSGYVLRNQSAIQSLGKSFTIAGAGIVGSLGMMIKKAADYGDNMDEMSQKTGVAIGVLSGLKLAADKDGTSIEGLAMGLKGLSGKIVEANSGNKEAIALFGKLGVSVTDANGKIRPMKDVLFDTATAFSKTEAGAEKTKTAVDLFGRAGMEMIPLLNRGADGLEREWKEAERLGLVLDEKTGKAASDFNDQLENLKGSMMGVAVQMGQALMPTIQKLITTLTSVIAGVRAWAAEHPGLAALLSKVALAVGALGMALGPVLIALPTLIKLKIGLKAVFPGIIDGLKSIKIAQVAASAAYGIAIGLIIQYAAKLIELKDAIDKGDKSHSAFIETNINLKNKLYELVKVGAMTVDEFYKLEDQLGGSGAAMAMWIKNGKAGKEAQEALVKIGKEHATAIEEQKKKLQGIIPPLQETTALWVKFLESSGISTTKQESDRIKELQTVISQLKSALDNGAISQENYAKAIKLVHDELFNLGKLTTTIIPLARNFGDIIGQAPSQFSDAAYASQTFAEGIKTIGDWMGVSSATIMRELYNIRVAFLQTLGIFLPKWEEVSASISETAKSAWSEVSTIVADACKSIASSIVEAFGIQKALTYQAKEFDKSYYENLKNLAEDAYDATKKLIQDQVDAVKKAYDEQVGVIKAKFEEAKEAANRYYEELEKGARRSSDKVEQAFKKYYDGLILQVNRAYDRQEVIYSRQAEDEERRYSRQFEDQERAYGRKYEREKKAIENSKMTAEEKEAAILALEKKYENEKIKRERAYEDAKEKRERKRENEKIQREIQKENRIAQIQEQARQKEYQLQIQLQNRLEQLARQRENRLKQLDRQKESRERAAERRREAAEKALQDRLLALQAKHDAEVEALRKAEDTAREKHARDEERRQGSLWNKVKGIFANAIEQMATIWLTRLIAGIIPSFDLIGNKAKSTFGEGEGGIVGTVKKATGSIGSIITSLATTIGTVLTTIATSIATVVTTFATAIGTTIVTLATAIGTAIVTLATSIATGATALAAAAPALITLGLIATGVYAAWKLIGKLLGGGGKQTDVTFWLKPISERAQEIRDWLFINAQERLNFLNIQISDLKDVVILHVGNRLMAFQLGVGRQLQNIYTGTNPYLRIISIESRWLPKISAGIQAMIKALTSKHTIYVRDEILTNTMGEANKGIKQIAKPISGPMPFSPFNRPISGPVPRWIDTPNHPISGPVPHDDPAKPIPKPRPIPIIEDSVTWLKRIHARVANISNIMSEVFSTPSLSEFNTPNRPMSGPIIRGVNTPNRPMSGGGGAGANVNITFNISSPDAQGVDRLIMDKAGPAIVRTVQRAFKTRQLHVPASAVGGS